jgi:hypothetical protein
MSEREAFVVRTRGERAGDVVTVTLTVDLPPSVHIEPHEPPEPYLIPTVLEVEGLGDVEVEYPTPVVKDLGWKDAALTVLEGRITFRVRGRLDTDLDRVRGRLSYQPCVGGACLPPRTIGWESPVTGTTAYSVLGAVAA